MNLLFLSCAYSDTQKTLFLKNSKRGYQFAAQNLQEALIDGLMGNGVEPMVLSIPALSTFPFGYKRLFVKGADFSFEGRKIGESFGFLNIPFLNNVSDKRILKSIDRWFTSTRGEHCIIVYALLYPQMNIAVEAKKRHPDIKISIIVPDLTRFMSYNRIVTLLGVDKKMNERIDALIPQFDGFVVLAKPMIKDLGIEGKPNLIIEGIYRQASKIEDKTIERGKDKKIIFYGGALSLRYGIADLIDAFKQIKGNDYRLWLCGTGDAVPYILSSATMDKRISYKGVVSRKDVEHMMKQATLLVNPRHSNEEFTKYSFPSKTLDYMASGTPVLMSHLESIPSEYDDFLFYFKDESKDGMAKSMKEVCEMDAVLLRSKGERAQSFIFEKKNPISQVKEIVNLIERI